MLDTPIYKGKVEECPDIQWILYDYGYGEEGWTEQEIATVNTLMERYLQERTPPFNKWEGGWQISKMGKDRFRATKYWWTDTTIYGPFIEMLEKLETFLKGDRRRNLPGYYSL